MSGATTQAVSPGFTVKLASGERCTSRSPGSSHRHGAQGSGSGSEAHRGLAIALECSVDDKRRQKTLSL
ncbi:hypothetical protein FA13DRAFT_1724531, partial [Coprinellus micaceus]